jgi:hypothetical protein
MVKPLLLSSVLQQGKALLRPGLLAEASADCLRRLTQRNLMDNGFADTCQTTILFFRGGSLRAAV